MRAHERGPLDMTQVLERQEYFFYFQFLAAGRADETRLTQKYVYRQISHKKHEE